MSNHHEADHKARLVKALKMEAGVRVQRFEDAFSVGLVDMFIGWKALQNLPAGGLWLEAKYHEITSGVMLPQSKITGNQIAWIEHWDGAPHPTGVILFTDKGWIVCPTKYVLDILCTEKSAKVMHLLDSYPVRGLRAILHNFDRTKQWASTLLLATSL
jgi:hypothetical protein